MIDYDGRMFPQHRVVVALALGGLAATVACSPQNATPKAGSGSGSIASGGSAASPELPPPPPATAPAAPGPSFAGSFRGAIQGTPATLTARQQAGQISGTIDAGGYGYVFEGQVSGARASGTVKDPQTGGAMTFEASLAGGDLRFVIVIANGGRLELDFQRTGAGAATGPTAAAAASPPATSAPAAKPAAADQRDPRLIGSWRYTEQLGDPGTGTMLIVWHLVVRPDGTYTYGNDRSQQHGRWRTQGNIVQVSDGGAWTPYARFTLDGSKVLFVFGDGSRKLWHRN